MKIDFENFKKGFTDNFLLYTKDTQYHELLLRKIRVFNVDYIEKYSKLLELYVSILNDRIAEDFKENKYSEIANIKLDENSTEEFFISNFVKTKIVPICEKPNKNEIRLDSKSVLTEMNWRYFQNLYANDEVRKSLNKKTLDEVLNLYKEITPEIFQNLRLRDLIRAQHEDKIILMELGYYEAMSAIFTFTSSELYNNSKFFLNNSIMFNIFFSINTDLYIKKDQKNIEQSLINGWLHNTEIVFDKKSKFLDNEQDKEAFLNFFLKNQNDKYIKDLSYLDLPVSDESKQKLIDFKQRIIKKLKNKRKHKVFSLFNKNNEIDNFWALKEEDFSCIKNLCVAKIIAHQYPERYISEKKEREEFEKLSFPIEEMWKDFDLSIGLNEKLINGYIKSILKEGFFSEDIIVEDKKGYIIINKFKEEEIDVYEIKDFIISTFRKEVFFINEKFENKVNDVLKLMNDDKYVENEWRAFILNRKLKNKKNNEDLKSIKRKI